MKNFNAKLIKADESLKNKKNKDWWENNPMTYDWKKEYIIQIAIFRESENGIKW